MIQLIFAAGTMDGSRAVHVLFPLGSMLRET